MTTSVSVDLEEIENLLKRLEDVGKKEQACKKATKALAGRYLRLVIDETPKGEYPKSSGKQGGTLKRGWTGGEKKEPEPYAKTLPVKKESDTYEVECVNNTKYASYVEYGHRIMRKGVQVGYVPPRYFMKKATLDMETVAPNAIKYELTKYLKEVFNG